MTPKMTLRDFEYHVMGCEAEIYYNENGEEFELLGDIFDNGDEYFRCNGVDYSRDELDKMYVVGVEYLPIARDIALYLEKGEG